MRSKKVTKNKQKKIKNKKKGFTLVELLAVIIILAIVVGITIPAVLTTTNNTKQKAFETAAQSVADWVDRQYSVYKTGLDTTGLAVLDDNFKNLCIRTCYNSDSAKCNGRQIGSRTDYYNANDTNPGKCDCNCDARLIRLTDNFIAAAGLQPSNIKFVTTTSSSYINGWRVQPASDGVRYITAASSNAGNTYSLSETNQKQSKVYINPDTGRSCITLVASSNGDYPAGGVACGGTCQSTEANKPDFCKPTT